MRVKVVQEYRHLFEASFNILESDNKIGKIDFHGKIGTPESLVLITVDDVQVAMKRINHPDTKDRSAYRPYEVVSSDVRIGEIFQAIKKKGLFKSYGYQYACIKGVEYTMYPIGLGKQGIKNPIYRNSEQIGLISKNTLVTNDLHEFDIILKEPSLLIVSLIITSYMYAKTFFRPGEQIKEGIFEYSSITTEKELVDKYDESFETLY